MWRGDRPTGPLKIILDKLDHSAGQFKLRFRMIRLVFRTLVRLFKNVFPLPNFYTKQKLNLAFFDFHRTTVRDLFPNYKLEKSFKSIALDISLNLQTIRELDPDDKLETLMDLTSSLQTVFWDLELNTV